VLDELAVREEVVDLLGPPMEEQRRRHSDREEHPEKCSSPNRLIWQRRHPVAHDNRGSDTRRVIRLALWRLAGRAIGDEFEDRTFCWVEEDDAPYWAARHEVAARVARFHEYEAGLDEVEAASVGSIVTLADSDAQPFVEALRSLRRGIEDTNVFQLTQDERQRVMDAHAAASALLKELGVVEAVA
jgi:hypothetical protein